MGEIAYTPAVRGYMRFRPNMQFAHHWCDIANAKGKRMTKGRRSDFNPRGAAPAGGGVQPDMMEKIRKMQSDMADAQAALETELVNVTAAGGAIQIVITGHQRVQSIKIDPALIDPADAGMLEDSIVAAVNEAIVKSQEHSAARLEAISGGLNIPGLM
jgi:nucleoid-associated protein EbfC